MGTSTVLEDEPGIDLHRPIDRLVTPGRRGVWEVRAPDAAAMTLYADNKHTATEWAWNITRGTGGTVVVHPTAGTCRACESPD